MRTGRRLTALGTLAAGLLLVGTAAPSLADPGPTATDTTSVATDGTAVSAPGADGTGDLAASSANPSGTERTAGPAAAPRMLSALPAEGSGPCSFVSEPYMVQPCLIDYYDGCDDHGPYDDPCPPSDPAEEPCTTNPDQPQCADDPQPGDGGVTPPDPQDCTQVPLPAGCLPDPAPQDPLPPTGGGDGGVLPGTGPGQGSGNGPGSSGPGGPATGNGGPKGSANGPATGSANGTVKGHHGGSAGAHHAASGPSAGGSLTSTAQIEGTRPGADVAGVSAGISACADTLCQSAVPVAAPVAAQASTATTTQQAGETMPQTGAPAHDRLLALLGAALVLGGAGLMRPRRAPRHRRTA